MSQGELVLCLTTILLFAIEELADGEGVIRNPPASNTYVIEVSPGRTAGWIRERLANATESVPDRQTLTVCVYGSGKEGEPHEYTREQLDALFTTRTDDTHFISAADNSSACNNGTTRTTTPVGNCKQDNESIIYSWRSNMKLSGMHFVACHLVFENVQEGGVLENLTFSGSGPRGRYHDSKLPRSRVTSCEDANVAALTILRAANDALQIIDCHFRNNMVTPVRLVNSSVSITGTEFEANVVDTATYQESECPSSAGVAVWHDPQNAMVPYRISLSHCLFKENTLHIGNTTQSDDATVATAGGAMNIVLTTTKRWNQNDTADQVNIFIDFSTFEKNSVTLQDPSQVLLSRDGLGHGGAVSIRTYGPVKDAIVRFRNCNWTNNAAIRGAGIGVAFYSTNKNNTVVVEHSCLFEGNLASGQRDCPFTADQYGFGGAINFEVHGNGCLSEMHVRQSVFLSNTAFEGGAINVALCYYQTSCTHVSVAGCQFKHNRAQLGAAMNWRAGQNSQWHDFLPTSSAYQVNSLNTSNSRLNLIMEDLLFFDNVAFYRGAVAVANLQLALMGTNEFDSNANTALLVQKTACYLAKGAGLVFFNNSGVIGGGACLQESYFIIDDNSSIVFHQNSALSKGGALFVANTPISSRFSGTIGAQCFVISATQAAPTDWKFVANFTGNRASSGAAIYSRDLSACTWSPDGVFPPPKDVFPWCHFNNNYLASELEQLLPSESLNGTSIVEMASPLTTSWKPPTIPPDDITLTEENDITTDVYKMAVFPDGQPMTCDSIDWQSNRLDGAEQTASGRIWAGLESTFSAIACDQLNNTVSAVLHISTKPSDNSVSPPPNCTDTYHQYSRVQNTETSVQPVHIDSESLVNLLCERTNSTCTIGPVRMAATLVEETQDFHDGTLLLTIVGSVWKVQVTVRVSFRQCPAAFTPQKAAPPGLDRCTCEAQSDERIFWCDSQKPGIVYIARGLFAAMKNDSHNMQIITCPTGYCVCKDTHPGPGCQLDIRKLDELNSDDQCQENRTGMLCGKCKPGLVPGTSLNGKCHDASKCVDELWKRHLPPTFFICLLVVLALLRCQLRFYNSLRGFLFFSFAVLFILNPSDDFLNRLTKSEHKLEQIVHALINLAVFHLPGNGCFYPSNNALEVTFYSFITPLIALSTLFPAILIVWCDPDGFLQQRGNTVVVRKLRWLVKFNKPEATILLILFFIVQSILITSARLLCQCISILGEYKFFWDGSEACWKGEHLRFSVVSAVLVLFVFILIVLMRRISIGKFGPLSSQRWVDFLDPIKSALTEDLDHGAHWWWSWDLLRRIILLIIYTPVTFDWWVKRIVGLMFIVISLFIHIRVWPYLPRSGHGRFSRTPRDWYPFSFLPIYLRNALRSHWQTTVQDFPMWNVSETFLLFLLCIVGLMGSSSAQGGVPNIVGARTVLLQIIVSSTVFIGAAILLIELFSGKEGQQARPPVLDLSVSGERSTLLRSDAYGTFLSSDSQERWVDTTV